MGADLELLTRVLIDVGRADDAELLDLRGQGHRPGHGRAGALRRFHDEDGRLVEDPVIVSLEADAYLLAGHGSTCGLRPAPGRRYARRRKTGAPPRYSNPHPLISPPPPF